MTGSRFAPGPRPAEDGDSRSPPCACLPRLGVKLTSFHEGQNRTKKDQRQTQESKRRGRAQNTSVGEGRQGSPVSEVSRARREKTGGEGRNREVEWRPGRRGGNEGLVGSSSSGAKEALLLCRLFGRQGPARLEPALLVLELLALLLERVLHLTVPGVKLLLGLL